MSGTALRRTIGRVRQPAYTGDNRCRPCTILNVILAGAVSLLAALLWVPAGILVFAAALSVIALRGYLVPGTPTLVRSLPDAVHDAIGSPHAFETEMDSHGPDGFGQDIEASLTTAVIVRPCDGDKDLCLTDWFRRRWEATVAKVDGETERRERLAAILSIPVEDVEIVAADGHAAVEIDGKVAAQWPSDAALAVDLASEEVLGATLGGWEDRPAHDRAHVIASLRMFVEECPTCGGTVQPAESVVSTCCRGDVMTVELGCVECGAVLFEGTQN